MARIGQKTFPPPPHPPKIWKPCLPNFFRKPPNSHFELYVYPTPTPVPKSPSDGMSSLVPTENQYSLFTVQPIQFPKFHSKIKLPSSAMHTGNCRKIVNFLMRRKVVTIKKDEDFFVLGIDRQVRRNQFQQAFSLTIHKVAHTVWTIYREIICSVSQTHLQVLKSRFPTSTQKSFSRLLLYCRWCTSKTP